MRQYLDPPDLNSKWVGDLTSNTLMNSESLDPRSLSMACLVDKLHPRGPGVKSFLSWGENHHISIIIYIIYIYQAASQGARCEKLLIFG